MSRRNLLGSLAVLVTVTPTLATQTVHPDVTLFASCAEHVRLAREERRLLHAMRVFDASDVSGPAVAAEKAWEASCDQSHAALEAVVGMQATTMEGAAAKARSVMAYVRSIENPGDTDAMLNFDEMAARSVLRDFERLAGGVA